MVFTLARRVAKDRKKIDAYTHPPISESEQVPDTAPGSYYVSIRDGSRFGLLAGPFTTHREALDMVPAARQAAHEHNSTQATWASFGTCRMESSYSKPGILNKKLGIQ